MGIASDLGYTFESPNGFQRAMQSFGSTRAGAWFFSKTLRHMDRVVHRLSKGRTSVPMMLAGMPVVLVTTTGRRSGARRTTPLVTPPIADTLSLVGTNFGQANTPGWVFNLEADPSATVEYRGTRREVIARPANMEERAEIWKVAGAIYGGYTKYQERLVDREVRLFVLEPSE